MSDFIEKLTSVLEPTIIDLDSKIEELDLKNKELESIESFLNYVSDDPKRINSYSNQSLLIDILPKINSNENTYNASCYLLSSDDDNVMRLPQYDNAVEYLKNIIYYMKNEKIILTNNVADLEKICCEKKLNKKYYEIFKSTNPVVEDVTEFSDFLENQILDEETKINILMYVIKQNVKEYRGR